MLFKDRLKVIERYYSWVEKHEKEEGIEIPKNFQSFMAYLDSRDLLVDPDGEYVKKADLLAKAKYYEDGIDSGFHYIEKDDIDSLQTYSAHIDHPQEWTIDFSNIKCSESDNKREWIPVSERLPEESGRYLTYIVNEYDKKLQYIMTADYISRPTPIEGLSPWNVDDECASDNVVAWQPLPEPYKKGE